MLLKYEIFEISLKLSIFKVSQELTLKDIDKQSHKNANL